MAGYEPILNKKNICNHKTLTPMLTYFLASVADGGVGPYTVLQCNVIKCYSEMLVILLPA